MLFTDDREARRDSQRVAPFAPTPDRFAQQLHSRHRNARFCLSCATSHASRNVFSTSKFLPVARPVIFQNVP
jgi:hypothetical protein